MALFVCCATLAIDACGTGDESVSGPVFAIDTGAVLPLDVATADVTVAVVRSDTAPSGPVDVLMLTSDGGSLTVIDVATESDVHTPSTSDAGRKGTTDPPQDAGPVPDAYTAVTVDAGPSSAPDVSTVADASPPTADTGTSLPVDAGTPQTADGGTSTAVDIYVPPPLTKAQLLTLGDKLLKGAACLKKDSPTCPGAQVQAWQLEDFQDSAENKANYKKVYGLTKFKGKVIVMALLSGW